MKKYLLDTNICIFYIKGLYQLDRKIEKVGEQTCFISEMTVAELKFGIENSKTQEIMRPIVEAFIPKFAVIPIYNALDLYAYKKAKLRRQGLLIDDFDILIGVTSIANQMVMVSKNTKHMSRLDNVNLQDWTTSEPK